MPRGASSGDVGSPSPPRAAACNSLRLVRLLRRRPTGAASAPFAGRLTVHFPARHPSRPNSRCGTASTATLSRQSGAARRIVSAHESSVAPVVSTSSTSRRWCPASLSGRRTAKIPSTLSYRSAWRWSACAGLLRMRRTLWRSASARSDPLGQVLRLIVASAQPFAPVERHGDDPVHRVVEAAVGQAVTVPYAHIACKTPCAVVFEAVDQLAPPAAGDEVEEGRSLFDGNQRREPLPQG